MLTEERQAKILELLMTHTMVKARDLVKELGVSESTIRRDLQEMEEEGVLKRVHGGAKRVIKLEEELNMTEKSFKNVQEKQRIGAYAASLVKEGEYIYLDAGTTTYEMIPFLKEKTIHIITNSVYHAALSIDYQIPTTMIGGGIRQKTKATVSHASQNQLRDYYFDKAFMGANGIHPEYGFTTADADEAAMKNTAMKQAQQVFMLVDSSKYQRVNFSRISRLDEAVLVVDTLPADLLRAYEEVTTVKEVGKINDLHSDVKSSN